MEALYKLHVDYGRSGCLSGLFIAEKENMDKLVEDKTIIYFGDVLGKHSDIHGELTNEDFTMVTDDVNVIKLVRDYKLENGPNPFHYVDLD